MSKYSIPWNNVKIEFIPYINVTGGRVWIGNIFISDVYKREKGDKIKYEFYISSWIKHQPVDKWLEQNPTFKNQKKFNTIEEGLQWILKKLKQ